MMSKILQLPKIITRDGLQYTIRRGYAFLLSHSFLAYRISFPYYRHTRLLFTPTQLTYGLFASTDTRAGDVLLLETYLKTNSIYVDVGANIGSLSVVAAAIVGNEGRVIAFEPSPKFARICNLNLKLNHFQDHAKVHEVALGASAATVFLDETVTDDTTNSISNTGTPVQQATLDSFTNNLSVIDLLKIDVEGYEAEVLKGALQTLPKTRVIYIEFISSVLIRKGVSPDNIISMLTVYFSLYIESKEGLISFAYQSDQDYAVNLIGLAK